MASVVWQYPRTGIWRFSRRDSTLVALAALHAAILVAWPVAPVIALGVWWNSNTIAHNFIHRPFFRSPRMNRAFSAALSVLLGIPQTLWRDRHLAHHAGVECRLRVSRRLVIETALVGFLWAALASLEPRFFLLVYVPGYLAGLALCAMQGHWEHAVGRPTSHYGRIYNFLCFNDGYHAEHHAAPAIHWTELPRVTAGGAATSQWPALMRWLDLRPLEALERIVLRSPRLQRFVLRTHRRAFQALLPRLQNVRSVTIVGGGLFPRTALILQELLPAARLTIVDSDADNLETARGFLDGKVESRSAEKHFTEKSRLESRLAAHCSNQSGGPTIEYRNLRYEPGDSGDCDLTVVPLCLEGDRAAIYSHPPSPAVLVHDWIWRRRGTGAVVSAALLKRINFVRQARKET